MPVLYILLGVLGIVLLLLAVATLRAVMIRDKTPLGEPIVPDAAKAQKYAEDLAAMIRCRTINAPDIAPEVTHAAFEELRALQKRLFPLCHRHMETTLLGDALLMRWPGKDPKRGAIVLMSHSDVVPATGSWKHPPFGGVIEDGRVWGRGTVDTKGSLCAIFEAAEGLLQEGFVPPCDVYISSSNDEETMGGGAQMAVEYLKERGVTVDLVSDEGGAVLEKPLAGLSGYYALLGIVEKGYANVRFTAKSTGGHASAPGKNTPLARLSAFVCDVEKNNPFKKEISQPVRDMFAALAPHMTFFYRLLLGNLWLFAPLLKGVLPKVSAQAGAMLQTTCAFTMATGSSAPNAIPETASITANLRFIMHQPQEESIAVIKAIADKYDLETEVLYANDCSPFVDVHSANYQYMVRCVQKTFPDVRISPFIMIGGTDARHFSGICPCTVRFSPLIMNGQQLGGMHGLDENVYINSLARGVAFYTNVLKNYSEMVAPQPQ